MSPTLTAIRPADSTTTDHGTPTPLHWLAAGVPLTLLIDLLSAGPPSATDLAGERARTPSEELEPAQP